MTAVVLDSSVSMRRMQDRVPADRTELGAESESTPKRTAFDDVRRFSEDPSH